MNHAVVLFLIVVATTAGDYSLKIASGEGRLLSSPMLFGLILYSIPAFGWMYLMKSHSLAQIGVIYSAATILVLFALSILVFREEVSRREYFGAVLALGAIFSAQH